VIEQMEEFYCERMTRLIDDERYDDAHAIYEEFVVNDEEPEEFLYIGVGDV
jgi:hypothetical protein